MIRLHLFDLDDPPEPASMLRGILTVDETARADRFRRPRDRDRYIAGRAILRMLLGEACGIAPAEISLAYGPHGKPELADGRPGRPTFGVSHAENVLTVALRPTGSIEVGVDVELVRPVESPEGVAERVFTPEEAAHVVWAAVAHDWVPFHRYWTAKEAVLKALGTGLSLDPRALRVRPGAGDEFGVEPAGESIPGLPDRGVWIPVTVPGTSQPARAAIVALAPVEVGEDVEVRPIDARSGTAPEAPPRDPGGAAE